VNRTSSCPSNGHRPVLVIHVFQVMDRGGAEIRTLEVLRHVDFTRVQPLIVTLSGCKGELASEFEEIGIDVVPMRLDFLFPLSFMRLLRAKQADAVHSHVSTFSGVPLLLASLARVPTRIAHFRSTGDEHGHSMRRRVQRAVMRALIDRTATAILGVAPAVLDQIWRADWEEDPRCRVLPTGVDPPVDTVTCRLEGPPVIAHIARPLPEKNRERAVEVFAAYLRRHPDARLLMVGRTLPQERLLLGDLADRLGATRAIVFTGEKRNVRDLLSRCDALLVTSAREGLPGVVLEGLSVGTPCLSSDIPGARFIAERLEGVRLQSLCSTNDTWAAALEKCSRRASASTRGTRMNEFAASDFTAAAVASSLTALWTRGIGDELDVPEAR
jgi:glycosyltransferase involved in cell wall biosynthesis